jgi:hypothetical protein
MASGKGLTGADGLGEGVRSEKVNYGYAFIELFNDLTPFGRLPCFQNPKNRPSEGRFLKSGGETRIRAQREPEPSKAKHHDSGLQQLSDISETKESAQ